MRPHLHRRVATYAVALVAVLVGAFLIFAEPIEPGGPPELPPLAQPLPATFDGPTTEPEPYGPGVPTVVPTATGPTTTAPAPTTPRPAPTTTKVDPDACRKGTPSRLVYPALDVDAWFEKIGLDKTRPKDSQGRYPLGNPSDRTKAGWYAAGPAPGTGQGTVLTNGHTYRNNSAIFKEDFALKVQKGQLIHVLQKNGTRCSYVVTRVWREVEAATEYPKIIGSQNLYDFTGPERLLLVTCGGDWNAAAQDYDQISIVLAEPVDR